MAAAALSFRIDFFTTLVALFGLLTVGTGLRIADPAAAAIIGVVMLISAVRILRVTLVGLTDRAPAGVADEVRLIAGQVPGAERVSIVRVRQLGDRIFIEVTIIVDGEQPFRQVQKIKDTVMQAVVALVDGAHCTVMAEPQ